jgi:FERM central domain
MIILLESFDNANDLKIAIIKKLKIPLNKFNFFGIYEIFEGEFYEERYIEENELIMDLVSYWNSLEQNNYKLLFKIRVFIYQGIKDSIVPFVYIQCAFDVLRGITIVNTKILIILSALKLLIDMGRSKVLEGYLSSNLMFYIPVSYLKNMQMTDEEWIEKILKKYSLLPDLTKLQAQAKFIELLSKCPLFGCGIFYINFQEASGSHSLPKEVMISLNSFGVVIHTRDHRRELMKYEYSEINSWGVSEGRFALFVSKSGYQVQFLFKTNQGRVIGSLMQSYINFKLGKPITNITENDPKFRKLGITRELVIKFPPLSFNLFK